jgi:UDP-N-acetylglucosamine acyltransferase
MSEPRSRRIHPTAVIAPEAELADDVEIGAFAVLDGPVRLGRGCIIRPGAYLFGSVTMGKGNVVYSGAVLGEQPQHLKYRGEPTSVEVGDFNTIRENVTVHRGTTHSMKTVIGSHNDLMAGAHVAHDCVIGDYCTLAGGALLAGHCVLADSVTLSGNSVVNQFVRLGRLALLSGCSGSTKDVPPFIVQQKIDTVCGIHFAGMRRAGMAPEQVNAVKQAFRILYHDGLSLSAAIATLEHELGRVDVVREMIQFLRGCTRGIAPMRSRFRDEPDGRAAGSRRGTHSIVPGLPRPAASEPLAEQATHAF